MNLQEFATAYRPYAQNPSYNNEKERKALIKEYLTPWLEEKFGKNSFIIQCHWVTYSAEFPTIAVGTFEGAVNTRSKWINKLTASPWFLKCELQVKVGSKIRTSHVMLDNQENFRLLVKEMFDEVLK